MSAMPSRMRQAYWTAEYTVAETPRHQCRECKTYIAIGEEMVVRRGARIQLRYHLHCFSGDADPRTQRASSFAVRALPIAPSAPSEHRGKYF